ncbi:MAG: hypothetical protein OZ948_05740 [Deltaproteobacteria bacterium]|nr:hypothetical protein [Deltaproteobacteria bacterium]
MRPARRALALLAALLPLAAGAGETRVPLQVLAPAPIGGALRAIDAFDWCGNEPRAELYLADPATVVALALRGERADVVVAAGPEALAPLVAAGLALAPQRFSSQDGVDYWIAPLRAARTPGAAQEFVDAVLSARGQAVLRRSGFGPRRAE